VIDNNIYVATRLSIEQAQLVALARGPLLLRGGEDGRAGWAKFKQYETMLQKRPDGTG